MDYPVSESSRAPMPLLRPTRKGLRLGHRWLRNLAGRHYGTAKAFFQLGLWLESARHGDPLLVYQMGKVGSTSVVRALRAAGYRQPIYHLHDLSPATLDRNEQIYRRKFRGEWQRPSHVWTSQYLRRQLDRPYGTADGVVGVRDGRQRRPWKIITLTRDPVARNLSAFFQTLELEHGWDPELRPEAANLEELGRLFVSLPGLHEYPLTWFDAELKRMFDIDVYASPFAQDQGYQVCAGPRAEVLVVKLEALDQRGPQAIHDFLQLDGFQVERANSAADKGYNSTYRRLRATLRLPDDFLDRMYASKYVRHFYSAAEIEQFRALWRSGRRALPHA